MAGHVVHPPASPQRAAASPPSRGDTRHGAWSQAEAEPITGGRRMGCHLDQPDPAHPLRLCAGWLAVIDPHHFRTRLRC
ncbi:hypothetical protein SMD20_43540 [Nonomuraea sp. LP-02]|uniref:hypothetical protein n=1 Tax=Nonomuraea sp. LP-02 TaxID=3097960 RepID=UPI002E375C56|nr:hypothetical protein [Nonomuraea sp. LP-02]MED7931158.1 hypothetical protein [Nonomuraea sp. LP-02]